jgi:hypothetical protein
LLIFLVGYLACQDALGNLGPSFFALTVLDAAACALLLARLSGPLERTLWAWIGLLLLLDGYFARMYWFAYHLNRPLYINKYYLELRWVTRARIVAGYPWATLGFVIFCLTAAGMLSFAQAVPTQVRDRPRTGPLEPWCRLIIALFVVYVLASLVQIRLGFGVRGLANPSLPFRLGTIITFLREAFIPSLLLLGVWVFDGCDRRWTRTTIWMLLISGIVDSLLSTSRGELLLFTMPIFALWAITGRFTRGRKRALTVVLLIATILVPIVSAIRVHRISGTAAPATHISVETLAQSAFFLGERAGSGGIEAIWYALDHKGNPSVSTALHYLHPYVFTKFYTQEIVGVSAANDFRSSGMFGAFIIIGSSVVLILFTIGVVVLTWSLWTVLRRARTWPVALSLSTVTIMLMIADPTGAVLTLPKLLLQVGLCEVVYRRLTRPIRLPASAKALVTS